MFSVEQIVVFALDQQRYGLRLDATERVLPAVELTSLPDSPSIVRGIFSLRGEMVPVLDIRRRFGLPPRIISPDQHMLVARTLARRVALLVDTAVGVVSIAAKDIVPANSVSNQVPLVQGIAQTANGIVLIHDLDAFLALDEARALDNALAAVARSP